jgi:hypothetical protein
VEGNSLANIRTAAAVRMVLARGELHTVDELMAVHPRGGRHHPGGPGQACPRRALLMARTACAAAGRVGRGVDRWVDDAEGAPVERGYREPRQVLREAGVGATEVVVVAIMVWVDSGRDGAGSMSITSQPKPVRASNCASAGVPMIIPTPVAVPPVRQIRRSGLMGWVGSSGHRFWSVGSLLSSSDRS